jgi:transcriptional regulator with XRE-family HTH domain
MSRGVNPRLAALGRRIREVRETRGVSQEDFALEAGLARSYYSGIERGRRNVASLNLMRIAIALNCDVGDFFPKTKDLRRSAG